MLRRLSKTSLFVFGTFIATLNLVCQYVYAQDVWTKYLGNPILDPGVPGEWDDRGIQKPAVVFDDGIYKMWYRGTPDGIRVHIGYATSSDGITWTKHPTNPVLDPGAPGEWDDVGVSHLTVLIDDNAPIAERFKMWFTGSDGRNNSIGYATSSDGTTWTKYMNNLGNPVLEFMAGEWDSADVNTPTVLIDDNAPIAERFKMWYAGSDGTTSHIGYATSSDGITWTKYMNNLGNPVLDRGVIGEWDAGRIREPTVLLDSNGYHMWYTGDDGTPTARIGYATSSDGINWIKYDDPNTAGQSDPVLDVGGNGGWDDENVATPTVLLENGIFKMWYSGGAGAPFHIGYTTSTPALAIDSPNPNQSFPAGTKSVKLEVRITNHQPPGHWHWKLDNSFPPSGPGGGNPIMSGNTANGSAIHVMLFGDCSDK